MGGWLRSALGLLCGCVAVMSGGEEPAAKQDEALLRAEAVAERIARFEDRRLGVYYLANWGRPCATTTPLPPLAFSAGPAHC